MQTWKAYKQASLTGNILMQHENNLTQYDMQYMQVHKSLYTSSIHAYKVNPSHKYKRFISGLRNRRYKILVEFQQ